MSDRPTGDLYAWGEGHTGVLGQGPGEDQDGPRPVPGLPPLTAVAAGAFVAYGIDAQGRVWSWGWDTENHLLGRGRAVLPPALPPRSLREMGYALTEPEDAVGGVGLPAVIDDLPPVVQIGAANDNTYLLTKDGEVWSWGDPTGLGRKARQVADRPERIAALPRIVQLSASPNGGTCYALDEDLGIWCWGQGHEGQLGHGKPRAEAIPVRIPSLRPVQSVYAGQYCAWALLEDGSVWFWGHGEDIGLTMRNSHRISEPVRIEGLSDIRNLYVGARTCVARNHAGETFALGGDNRRSMFDPDDESDGATPEGQLLRTPRLDRFEHLYLGTEHGLAVDANAALYGFGDAQHRALGDPARIDEGCYPPGLVPGMGGTVAAACGELYSLAIRASD